MNCHDVRDNLFQYTEGLTSRRLAILIRLHMAHCASCQQQFESLAKSRLSLIDALQKPVEMPDLSDSVMQRLSIAPRPSTKLTRNLRLALVPLAAAILVVISFVIYNQPRPVKNVAQQHQDSTPEVPKQSPKDDVVQEIPVQKHDVPTVRNHGKPQRKTATVAVTHYPHERKTPGTPPVRKEDQSIAREKPPVILIVATVPQETETSAIEIEVTNQKTGTVTIYNQVSDEDGNEQSTNIKFATDDSEKEGAL